MPNGPDDTEDHSQLDDFEQQIDDAIANDPDGEYDNDSNDSSSDTSDE